MTDYELLNDGCAIVPLRDRTQIEMRGSDSAAFLHNLCTNDIKRLQPGQGCEAFITDVRGKTIGHILAFKGREHLIIETVPEQAGILMAHFDKYLITEDVQLVDRTSDNTEIVVLGTKSSDVLNRVGLPAPAEVYGHDEGRLQGHAVSVRRVAMTSVPMFLLQATSDGVLAVAEALSSAGVVTVDDDLLETARIEFGWPKFGQDISADNLPQEINRDAHAISFTKGCYLGQETVARIDALGHVNRLLVGLRFESEQVPPRGAPLSAAGGEIGNVTSATYSPRLSAPFALGVIRTEYAKTGTCVAWNESAAEVTGLPVR